MRVKEELEIYIWSELEKPEVLTYVDDNFGMMPVKVTNNAIEILQENIYELNCIETEEWFEVELWQGKDVNDVLYYKKP